MASISNTIRKAILKSGMSGYQICKLTGINKATMSRFMTGKTGLNLESADKLCALLNLALVEKPKGRGLKR